MLKEAARLLQLPDEAYASLNDEALSDLSLKLSSLSAAAVPAPANAAQAKALPPLLVAAAPRRLARQSLAEWPVLIGRRTSGWRQWAVDWKQNARVLMIDMTTGRATQRLLWVSDQRQRTPMPSMGTATPSDFDAATVATGVQLYRPMASNPWPEAEQAAVIAAHPIVYDWRANPVVTELSPRPTVPAMVPMPDQASAVRPVAPDPAQAPAPFIPVLSAPARVEVGAPLLARLAFDVSAADAPLVERRSPAGVALDPAGAAWVAVTLLLVRRDQGLAHQADLWLPARVTATAQGRAQRATASAAVDLQALWPGEALRGLYQLYAFAGLHAAGPRPIVVGEKEGPERMQFGP